MDTIASHSSARDGGPSKAKQSEFSGAIRAMTVQRSDHGPQVVFVESIPNDLHPPIDWPRARVLEGLPLATELHVADPTLTANRGIEQGWGLGTSETFGIDQISEHVTRTLGPDPSKRTYVGSGAAGYIAIYLALQEGAHAAVVSNPDLTWHTSTGPSVKRLLDTLGPHVLATRVLDLTRVAKEHANLRVMATVNTAHPLYSVRIMTPLLHLLSTRGLGVDIRRSSLRITNEPGPAATRPMTDALLRAQLETLLVPFDSNLRPEA